MCQMNRWHRWHIPCLRKEHVRVKGRGVICLSQRKVTISSCWRKTRSRLSLPGGLVSVLYDTHVPNEWCGGMRGGRGIRSRQFLKCIDQQYPGGWAYLRKVSAHTRYRTTDLFITNEMLCHWAIWAFLQIPFCYLHKPYLQYIHKQATANLTQCKAAHIVKRTPLSMTYKHGTKWDEVKIDHG